MTTTSAYPAGGEVHRAHTPAAQARRLPTWELPAWLPLGVGLLLATAALAPWRVQLAASPLLIWLLVCALLPLMLVNLLQAAAARLGRAATPHAAALDGLDSLVPVIQRLQAQLASAVQDSEAGVMATLSHLEAVHKESLRQLDRIRSTETQRQALSTAIQEKVATDAQMGHILQLFLQQQNAEAQDHIERFRRLQSVKALSPMVDAIAAVARQTNFLSINASVEAARAGVAGRGFAVVAGEIRQLATETSSVAAEIAEKISGATSGLAEQLDAAARRGQAGGASDEMHRVLADISSMQSRFAQTLGQLDLQHLIRDVHAGHQTLAEQLAEAINKMQMHDVLQQRVQSVTQQLASMSALIEAQATLAQRPMPQTAEAVQARRLEIQQLRQALAEGPLVSPGRQPGSAEQGGGRPHGARIEFF